MENSEPKCYSPDSWLWTDNEIRFNSGIFWSPMVLPVFLFKEAGVFWAIAWIMLLASYLLRSVWAVFGEWWFLPHAMGERWVAAQTFGGLLFPLAAPLGIAFADARFVQLALWLAVYGWWLASAILGHHYPFHQLSAVRRRRLAIVGATLGGLSGLAGLGLVGLFSWRVFADPPLWFIMLVLDVCAMMIAAGLVWVTWWLIQVARHPEPPAASTAPKWN